MACHDIVPLGHNASASGHAEGTAPDSDGFWEAAGLEGTGSSLGLSSRGCEGYRNRKGKRKYRYRKGKRGFFKKKKKCCFHAFYETAQELVRGMLHRHFVQTGVC